MERDGVTGSLENVGAVVLANACGPCIGQVSNTSLLVEDPNISDQWKREDAKDKDNGTCTLTQRFRIYSPA